MISIPTRATDKRATWRVIFALLLLCALVFVSAKFGIFTYAADVGTYNIASAEDFNNYVAAYNAGNRNPRDTLQISISSGDVISDDSFTGLGTALQPFAGTIVVPTSGIDTFELFNYPLFNYVSTDLTVSGPGVIKIKRTNTASTGNSLFANHVVVGSGAANWNILLTSESTSTSFNGLFGDIAADCNVTVTFTNNANANVASSGNTGYICGTLNSGAALHVTTAGSGGNLSVTSTGGHAGGLVGEMKSGSTLKFDSANNTRVTSVSSASGYAGGIVGYADAVNIQWKSGVTDYAVSGTVSGSTGAGGLFGYYKNTASPVTFTLEDTYAIASGITVTSAGNTGGVFGTLENNGASFLFKGNKSGSETVNAVLSGGSARGGICGLYKTNALANTFEIADTDSTITAFTAADAVKNSNYSGGLIGMVTDAAYLSIHDVECTAANTASGLSPDAGLVGSIGEAGCFVDVFGTVKITDRFNAGLVCNMPIGVLRISGVTDLSEFQQWNSSNNWTSGLIVRDRARALIYALGSGSDFTDDGEGHSGGWTLKRNTTTIPTIDDIHTWGEVLRVDGTTLSENSLFTVNMTAHTVTVLSAVTSMSNVTDFAKTALNITLGVGDAAGALQFSSANQSTTLLSASLSLTGDIDLSGTGLLGLTRDDGTNAAFSGTLEGNDHTLTFATGEVYGTDGSGTALTSASSQQGMIRRHLYNGLFAKTAGATVQNLQLAGYYNIIQDVDIFCIGGVAAQATGNLTLTDLTVTDLTFHFITNSNYTAYAGGAVGLTNGSLNITVGKIDGSTFKPIFRDETPSDKGRGKKTYADGIVGYVSDGTPQSVSVTGITVGIDYLKNLNTARESCFGSVIAGIGSQVYAKDNRTLTLTNLTVDMTAIGTAADRRFGGILGTEWYATDVTISDLTVATADITTTSGTANFGGLVHTATGRWDLQSISLSSAHFTVKAGGSTFGFVANKTYTTANSGSALYLDIDNTGSNYNIAALSFSGSTGTFSSFDEVVADSRFNGTNLTSNGHSIISIKTSGNIISTTGGAYNTYLNKTDYGKDHHSVNPNTRYYYNIAYARANTATDKYNFLVRTVKEYAHASLAAWFPASSTFTGTLDMTGLSYYPVDLGGNVTFRNATLTLDNNLMESYVNHTDSSATTRTTRSSTNQHYLMHTAVFRNVTSDITIEKGTSGISLQGNVPKISDDFCGFFIAGTLGA